MQGDTRKKRLEPAQRRKEVNMNAVVILRWIARIGSVASTLLLLLFATSGGGVPRPSEVVALAFFPVGVVLGFGIAWWREGTGGAVTVLSLAAFYAWMTVVGGRFPTGPYFLLFAAPGFLFLACSLLGTMRRARTA
jgi:hypothetical protein